MTESKRNVAVGLTVLFALAALAFMILLFGELPSFIRGGYRIYMEFSSSGGVTEGTDVHLNGVTIGKITQIRFRDDPRQGVVFTAAINSDIHIPGDVNAYIYSKGFVGGAWVELASDNQPPGNLSTLQWLPPGYTLTSGKNKGSGLIPEELMNKVDDIVASFQAFGKLSNNLNKLIEPLTPETASAPASAVATGSAPATGPETQPAGLQGTLARLNRTLDAINTIFGDPQSQQNIKLTLANLRVASEQGAQAMQQLAQFAEQARGTLKSVDSAASTINTRVDDVADRIVQQADNLGRLLTTLNQAAVKMESGNGSAGQFLNDPKFYNNLVAASAELTKTLQELQTLAEQWRTQGAVIKMK